MRSERDIQRKPRRAASATPAEDSTPASTSPATTEPKVVVNAGVKVSYAPRTDRPWETRGEPRREDRFEGWRGESERRGPRPDDRGPRGDRPAFGNDRGPRTDRPAFGNDRGPRTDRPAFGNDRGPRTDRPAFGNDRGPRTDRPAFGNDRGPRTDRPAFGNDRGPRTDRGPRPERAERQERPAAGPQRYEGPARSDQPLVRAVPTPRQAPADAGERLSKVLAERGLSSRREADDWIAAGWVKVDGEMAVLGQRVTPQSRIEIDPAARTQQAKQVTILLHKPIGYVSGQAEDGYEPASVLVTAANQWAEDPSRKPFHPGHARGLAPAGRLDIDSTGLLVLTQDGRIAKHLIGDDSLVEKEYLVRVESLRGQPLAEVDLGLLQHGLSLDGVELKPAKVSWINEDQLRFVLREGRKRQVRRMCEAVGLKVTGLKRVRIGSVVLGKLPAGQWRFLREDERF